MPHWGHRFGVAYFLTVIESKDGDLTIHPETPSMLPSSSTDIMSSFPKVHLVRSQYALSCHQKLQTQLLHITSTMYCISTVYSNATKKNDSNLSYPLPPLATGLSSCSHTGYLWLAVPEVSLYTSRRILKIITGWVKSKNKHT